MMVEGSRHKKSPILSGKTPSLVWNLSNSCCLKTCVVCHHYSNMIIIVMIPRHACSKWKSKEIILRNTLNIEHFWIDLMCSCLCPFLESYCFQSIIVMWFSLFWHDLIQDGKSKYVNLLYIWHIEHFWSK